MFVTTQIALHNVFLLLAVELGLIGATLYGASFLAVVGSALPLARPPRDAALADRHCSRSRSIGSWARSSCPSARCSRT